MEEEDFEEAEQVFQYGSNAEPYATLQLDAPIKDHGDFHFDDGHDPTTTTTDLLPRRRPLVVLGMTEHQEPVSMFIRSPSSALKSNSLKLFVMYNETSSTGMNNGNGDDHDHVCHVGLRTNPVTNGCLASSGGLIVEGYGAVNYHYNMAQDNGFGSSLFGFSEHEAERMFHCKDKCPYPEYEKFYRYYGQMDYGAIWMKAALKGQSTSASGQSSSSSSPFTFVHGQEDFSKLPPQGRRVAVITAAVTMNVRTHVNRIMTEWAIDACRKQQQEQERECTSTESCFDAVAESWDQAVSLYVGSLVKGDDGDHGDEDHEDDNDSSSSSSSGHLYYGMADELCRDFATCGPNGDALQGTSAVNHDIIPQFQTGRVLLEKGSCSAAELTYGRIIHLMTVPLIQGALRSAFRLQFSATHKGDPEEQGRAVAFMASILPDLYSCSPQDADIVYGELNLSSGKTTPDFFKVKEAFERNYMCMAVTCEDVGGLYDHETDRYYDGASPCGKRRTRQSGRKKRGRGSADHQSNSTTSLIIQVFVIGSVAMAVVLLAVQQRERWVPVLSSRADVLLSRVMGARPVRYHEVHSHSLQLQPTTTTQEGTAELSDSYRSYGVVEEEDDIIGGSYRSGGGAYEMADQSDSSTDYHDIQDDDAML